VFVAALFDVLDGWAARALGGGSELGKQLDSLADMVSFGVAPALVLWFQLRTASLSDALGAMVYPGPKVVDLLSDPVLFASLLLIPIGSAWRLAKYNLDTRQTQGFLGLPTPSNGLFWISVVLIVQPTAVHPGPGHEVLIASFLKIISHTASLFALSVALFVLMLSSLPLPGLKLRSTAWKGSEVIYLLLGIGVVLVILYGVLAVPLILLLYLLSPLWGRLFPKTTSASPGSTGSP